MEFAFNSLKIFRQKYGYTQEQIAEKLGVSRQAVAKWERGDSLPDIVNVIALADLYEVSVDSLVRQIAQRFPATEGKKHLFGIMKVGENGEIMLPEKARNVFGIKAGDTILLLGDEEKGLALVKVPEING